MDEGERKPRRRLAEGLRRSHAALNASILDDFWREMHEKGLVTRDALPLLGSIRRRLRSAAVLGAQASAPLDLVIIGGRVIDPGSGLDAVRTIGIRDGRVVSIATGQPAVLQ